MVDQFGSGNSNRIKAYLFLKITKSKKWIRIKGEFDKILHIKAKNKGGVENHRKDIQKMYGDSMLSEG